MCDWARLFGRFGHPFPAQNIAAGHSGRIGQLISARAATFFHSAPKRYSFSAQNIAAGHSGQIRQLISRAGGYNFLSRAEKTLHSRAEHCRRALRAD